MENFSGTVLSHERYFVKIKHNFAQKNLSTFKVEQNLVTLKIE